MCEHLREPADTPRMKEVGPEHYRALHLVDADGQDPARRGVNPSSPIAVLLASLVVSAHGGADETVPPKPVAGPARGVPGHPAGARALATVDGLQARWRRAIGNDDTVTLGALVSDHPDVGLAQAHGPTGKSALMVAAKADDLQLAQALVSAGAPIDARTETGGTAMMFCALAEQLDVAQWLHARGGALDDVGSNGWTALTIAAARGFEPMVDWLLDAGAAPDPVDVYGYTPLMRSVENGHLETTLRLLGVAGLAIDHADESGNTALHHASAAGRTDLVLALLAADADTLRSNAAGYRASALVTGNPELARQLSGAEAVSAH